MKKKNKATDNEEQQQQPTEDKPETKPAAAAHELTGDQSDETAAATFDFDADKPRTGRRKPTNQPVPASDASPGSDDDNTTAAGRPMPDPLFRDTDDVTLPAPETSDNDGHELGIRQILEEIGEAGATLCPRSRRLTRKRACTFLAWLARLGNVTVACHKSGSSLGSVYDLREADAAFSRLWDRALQVATDLLALEARRRAVEGWDEEVYGRDGFVGTIRRYDGQMLRWLMEAEAPAKYNPRHRDKDDHGTVINYNITLNAQQEPPPLPDGADARDITASVISSADRDDEDPGSDDGEDPDD